MKPGRELDMLVAEKVMGLNNTEYVKEWTQEQMKIVQGWWPKLYPNYSTDIAAAWEVVEKIQCRSFELNWHLDSYNFVRIYKAKFQTTNFVYGETAAHAICLAALKFKNFEGIF